MGLSPRYWVSKTEALGNRKLYLRVNFSLQLPDKRAYKHALIVNSKGIARVF